MSVDPRSIPPDADAEAVLDAIESLQDRVDDLEATVEQKDERIADLEDEVDRLHEQQDHDCSVEIRSDDDVVRQEDIWIAGFPIGQVLQTKVSETVLEEELEDVVRTHDLANDDVVGEAGDLLPVMNVARAYDTDRDQLGDTDRRAAIVWKTFFDHCQTTKSEYVLRSTDVRKILAQTDENTHRETVKRVLDAVADLLDHYGVIEKRNGCNAVVIDRDAFDPYAEELTREVRS